MNIERKHLRVFNIISVLVLAAVLLTACGAMTFQGRGLFLKEGRADINRDVNSLLPAQAQTGPTGNLVMTIGMILLIVAFAGLVLILAFRIRRNILHPKPA